MITLVPDAYTPEPSPYTTVRVYFCTLSSEAEPLPLLLPVLLLPLLLLPLLLLPLLLLPLLLLPLLLPLSPLSPSAGLSGIPSPSVSIPFAKPIFAIKKQSFVIALMSSAPFQPYSFCPSLRNVSISSSSGASFFALPPSSTMAVLIRVFPSGI